mgnify:CR=1 FL=1
MLNNSSELDQDTAYQKFLNTPVTAEDFFPKPVHIPSTLPTKLQTFIQRIYTSTMIGRTYMFPSDPCMIWLGAVDEDGYGRIRVPQCATVDKPSVILSRFVYQHLVEDVDPDLEIHHQCGEPSCINTRHLSPLTPTRNKEIGDPWHNPDTNPWLAHLL